MSGTTVYTVAEQHNKQRQYDGGTTSDNDNTNGNDNNIITVAKWKSIMMVTEWHEWQGSIKVAK